MYKVLLEHRAVDIAVALKKTFAKIGNWEEFLIQFVRWDRKNFSPAPRVAADI